MANRKRCKWSSSTFKPSSKSLRTSSTYQHGFLCSIPVCESRPCGHRVEAAMPFKVWSALFENGPFLTGRLTPPFQRTSHAPLRERKSRKALGPMNLASPQLHCVPVAPNISPFSSPQARDASTPSWLWIINSAGLGKSCGHPAKPSPTGRTRLPCRHLFGRYRGSGDFREETLSQESLNSFQNQDVEDPALWLVDSDEAVVIEIKSGIFRTGKIWEIIVAHRSEVIQPRLLDDKTGF